MKYLIIFSMLILVLLFQGVNASLCDPLNVSNSRGIVNYSMDHGTGSLVYDSNSYNKTGNIIRIGGQDVFWNNTVFQFGSYDIFWLDVKGERDDHINISNSSSIFVDGENFIIEALLWVQNIPEQNRSAIYVRDSDMFEIGIIDFNIPDGYYRVSTLMVSLSNSTWVTAPYDIPLKEWHHIAVTYNGTAEVIYVDKMKRHYEPQSGNALFNVNNRARLGITILNTRFFNGHIDNFMISFLNFDNRCDESKVGYHSCGGFQGDQLYACKQFTQTDYQWDYENITVCKYGCYYNSSLNDYECFDEETKGCYDNCKLGTSFCSEEGTKLYNCVNITNFGGGCYNWDPVNYTSCTYGCRLGSCIKKTGECVKGWSKCEGNTIFYCGDYDGDGYYEYSFSNITTCAFACYENFSVSINKLNATCQWHSYDEIYSIRESGKQMGDVLSYMFLGKN